MSFKFILELLMMVSLGVLLYIIARTLPRISDTDTSPQSAPAPSWVIAYFEKADEWLLSFFEKFLRKFRLMLLKLDNSLMNKLGRIKKDTKKENGNGFETEEKSGKGDKTEK